MPKPKGSRTLQSKLVASVVVVVCVALGLVGLVLPVIPGLLFLALAALVAARHVPWIDSRLRSHRSFGPRMHRVDRFFRLSLLDQFRVTGLIGVKSLLDALDRVSAWLSKRVEGPGPRGL